MPRIASPPSSGGSSDATTERKKMSESRKMNGNASSSACAKSLPTCVFTWALAIASPPSLTSCWEEKRLSISLASLDICRSDRALKYATTYVERPSRATIAGSCVV